MKGLSLKSGALAVLMTLTQGIEAPSTTLAEEQTTTRTARLLERGPYGSGTMVISFVRPGLLDGAGLRTLPTKIWYPARDDAHKDQPNVLAGRSIDGFPLIVYGHGLGSEENDIGHVASHLASHGYVVASIRFPNSSKLLPNGKERTAANPPSSTDVAGQVLDMLHVAKAMHLSPLTTHINKLRTALMGYSLGGVTAAAAAEQVGKAPLLYPAIRAVATFAPAACAAYTEGGPGLSVKLPQLIISGDADQVTPLELNAGQLFHASVQPKYLVKLKNGSHAGFVNKAEQTLEPAAAAYRVNVDGVICASVQASVPESERDACELCIPGIGLLTPQAPVLQQQAIQKAAVLSFFEGYLRRDERDRAYLQAELESENREFVDVSFIGPVEQAQ